MNVAIVEDDPAVRALLQSYARLHELDVVATFASVDDAIGWPGWRAVHSVIVDWMMPGRTGGELLDWLALNHPSVRCVVVTHRTPLPSHPHAYAIISKDHLVDVMEALGAI